MANVPASSTRLSDSVERRHAPGSVDATAIDTLAAASPEPMPALAVTRVITGQPYPSSVTSYAADGSVSRVDLYGLARAFDHVRLDYRADGTLATRTLLDSERPAAAIVIDYDAAGARLARHEIALPDRPYARVDIVYDADGWAETRTRSGFADGDLVSVTVRFDAPGTIARVEHLHIDGTRLIVGTAGADAHQLAGSGESDTFVLVDADPRGLELADVHHAEGDLVDLSGLLGEQGHLPGRDAFDGSADVVRFDRLRDGSLVSIEGNGDGSGDKVTEASVALHGVHTVHPADFGF